jgi:hypothetical protein
VERQCGHTEVNGHNALSTQLITSLIRSEGGYCAITFTAHLLQADSYNIYNRQLDYMCATPMHQSIAGPGRLMVGQCNLTRTTWPV